MVLTKFFILLFFIFIWRVIVVLCFRDAFWSVHGWNDMMSGGCFKIIWGWEKVGGIVDKIRLALHWHLLKLGDSWGTLRFIILFFLLLCIFKNFHNKKWRKKWGNYYLLFLLSRKTWSALYCYVVHICFCSARCWFLTEQHNHHPWLWKHRVSVIFEYRWDLLNSIQYSKVLT